MNERKGETKTKTPFRNPASKCYRRRKRAGRDGPSEKDGMMRRRSRREILDQSASLASTARDPTHMVHVVANVLHGAHVVSQKRRYRAPRLTRDRVLVRHRVVCVSQHGVVCEQRAWPIQFTRFAGVECRCAVVLTARRCNAEWKAHVLSPSVVGEVRRNAEAVPRGDKPRTFMTVMSYERSERRRSLDGFSPRANRHAPATEALPPLSYFHPHREKVCARKDEPSLSSNSYRSPCCRAMDIAL